MVGACVLWFESVFALLELPRAVCCLLVCLAAAAPVMTCLCVETSLYQVWLCGSAADRLAPCVLCGGVTDSAGRPIQHIL